MGWHIVLKYREEEELRNWLWRVTVEGRDAQKRDARARWVMGLNYWALRRHLRGESEVP